MDWYTRKLAYLWLRLTEITVNLIVFFYALFFAKTSSLRAINSIGAFWYYPPDLTGSNLRIGGWRKYFEKEGYIFDNFHINKLQDYVSNIENGSWTNKYMFFSKCLWRRLPQILESHKYDVLWIDRCLIPYYPRRTAFIEKQIKKVVYRMVMDSTDGGDYIGNPELMGQIYLTADKITVGYKHLLKEFEKKYKSVEQVFWTIPDEEYIIKSNYSINGKPIIGWMGSPGNFNEVLKIKEALIEINKQKPFIFRYICRKNFNKELEGLNTEHHIFGEDYYSILASFDIGISPFFEKNMRTMGKIAMKHQEFLLVGVPQICSDIAISEFVEHKDQVLIACTIDEWKKNLLEIFDDIQLRIQLARRGRLLFSENYNYQSQFDKLKKTLVNT